MNFEVKYEDLRIVPELQSVEEQAKNIVVHTVNLAKERIGIRQELCELASAATYVWADHRLNLSSIETPFPKTGKLFISKTIEQDWGLTEVFKYCVNYLGDSTDEAAHYYYFEAIFSQPTPAYPIPQVAVSVFFRIEDKHTEKRKAPIMYFRIEGHSTDHDVRHVAPAADWLLAVMQQKLKFYRRIEGLGLF